MLPTTSTPLLLIDAGRSERGWSRIGNAFKCRQLYAWENVAGYPLISADALTRGSMGHAALAHHFARWGCYQGGCVVGTQWMDEAAGERLLSPVDAITAWCDQNKRGHEFISRMVETFEQYAGKHPEPEGRVLGVEVPIGATLGLRDGRWGLWVTERPSPLADPLDEAASPVEPTPLTCPGHPANGQPLRITRRLDLVLERSTGEVAVWDHKNSSSGPSRSDEVKFGMDGGFRSQAILASQVWPKFGHVSANVVQTESPWSSGAVEIRRSPWREARFPRNLYDVEHEVARLEVETAAGDRDVSEWPVADSDTTCTMRYGMCPAYKMGLCTMGPRGAGFMGPE